MHISDYYRTKKELNKLTKNDIHQLNLYYGINREIKTRNDNLWILALTILNSQQTMANMISFDKSSYQAKGLPYIAEYFAPVEKLGSGVYATTWKARVLKPINNLNVDDIVAIKLIEKDKRKMHIQIDEVIREIKSLKKLSKPKCHPNIVCYYGYLIDDNQICIITEYILGPTLDLVNIESNLLIGFMYKLCIGLKYIHDKNIVHRDIKPANIVVDSTSGEPKYIDFGLSCLTIENSQYYCIGNVIGSPIYFSPELISYPLSLLTPDKLFELYRSADLWALGLVFYQLIYKQLPPEHEKAITMNYLIKILTSTEEIIFPPTTINLKLVNIVRRMLSKRPTSRPTLELVIEEFRKLNF